MKSVTLIFPGQGSQYLGMGNHLQSFPEAKEIFQKADEALGFSISDICVEEPDNRLNLTEFTQPAIVTHSIALFTVVKKYLDEHGIKVDRVLGHSVGEYPALVAAGALRFEDAVKAVNLRGKFMQEAVAPGLGKMYAILRVPGDIVAKACEAASSDTSKVMCANFNDPTQVVISGHAEAADMAVQWLKENYEGKQMAKELTVSAPFHSTLMEPAASKLAEHLNTIEFKNNDIPYIANIDGKEYSTDGETIKKNLIDQVCGSVLWTQSMQSLPDETICLELGPGKVLTGLNKRINKTFKTLNMDQENPLEKLAEFLQ